MDHIQLPKCAFFDSLCHCGTKDEIFYGIGIERFFRVVVINVCNVPGLYLRMVQYIVEDVRKFLLWLYFVEFRGIAHPPQGEIDRGLGHTPMMEP